MRNHSERRTGIHHPQKHKLNSTSSSTTPKNKHMQWVTYILLLLDITNMFNEISQDTCWLLLLSTLGLKHMVPYFGQICKELNRCWYKTDIG